MGKTKKYQSPITSMTELENIVNEYRNVIETENPYIITKAEKEISFTLMPFVMENNREFFRKINGGYRFVSNLTERFDYSKEFLCIVDKFIDLSIYNFVLKKYGMDDFSFAVYLASKQKDLPHEAFIKLTIALVELDRYLEIDDYKMNKNNILYEF